MAWALLKAFPRLLLEESYGCFETSWQDPLCSGRIGTYCTGRRSPGFAHARKNSQLTALVSGDPEKLKSLGRRYGVDHLFSYDEYYDCLRSGIMDAVYIALPNHLHANYTIAAAKAGIHILCEKPMAVTEKECWAMIGAAEPAGVKLMIAYRLHFEEANMTAVKILRSGKLGDPRFFCRPLRCRCARTIFAPIRKKAAERSTTSVFIVSMPRAISSRRPTEVFAFSSASKKDERFKEIDEMTSVILRFPDGRLAEFSSSFGAADVASYRVVGTKGDVDSTKLTNTFIRSSSMSRSKGKPRSKPFANEISSHPSGVLFKLYS